MMAPFSFHSDSPKRSKEKCNNQSFNQFRDSIVDAVTMQCQEVCRRIISSEYIKIQQSLALQFDSFIQWINTIDEIQLVFSVYCTKCRWRFQFLLLRSITMTIGILSHGKNRMNIQHLPQCNAINNYLLFMRVFRVVKNS